MCIQLSFKFRWNFVKIVWLIIEKYIQCKYEMVILEMTQINLHALHGGFCVERNNVMRNIEAIETLINTSKYSKPYLSYEEQLLLLKHRGIKIEDERFALRQLETISYYSLINAYTPLFK